MISEIEMGDDPTALYRLYGADGVLLYVGAARYLRGEMGHHSRNSLWWPTVRRKTMTWYPTRADAEQAASEVIANEHPLHNFSAVLTNNQQSEGGPAVLYRLFNSEGELLYIGITGRSLKLRMQQHAIRKPWWGEVANTTVTHYETRQEAWVAETRAILRENPKYNVGKTLEFGALTSKGRLEAESRRRRKTTFR